MGNGGEETGRAGGPGGIIIITEVKPLSTTTLILSLHSRAMSQKGELLSPCPFACLFPLGQVVCCDDDVGGSLSFLSSDRFSKYIKLFSKNINRVYVRTYATYM